jgi:hypothetical protein
VTEFLKKGIFKGGKCREKLDINFRGIENIIKKRGWSFRSSQVKRSEISPFAAHSDNLAPPTNCFQFKKGMGIKCLVYSCSHSTSAFISLDIATRAQALCLTKQRT